MAGGSGRTICNLFSKITFQSIVRVAIMRPTGRAGYPGIRAAAPHHRLLGEGTDG